jgi:hypothetical protein
MYRYDVSAEATYPVAAVLDIIKYWACVRFAGWCPGDGALTELPPEDNSLRLSKSGAGPHFVDSPFSIWPPEAQRLPSLLSQDHIQPSAL